MFDKTAPRTRFGAATAVRVNDQVVRLGMFVNRKYTMEPDTILVPPRLAAVSATYEKPGGSVSFTHRVWAGSPVFCIVIW